MVVLLPTIPACCYLEQAEGIFGVYSIVLNRPKARNALSVQMVNEFAAALDKVASDRL